MFKLFKIQKFLLCGSINFFSICHILGALLLAFPIAYQDNKWPSFVNALLSTSCVCVTD